MQQTPEPFYTQGPRTCSGVALGGLGTGSVEIRDDGGFHDWEIFNNHLWSGSRGDAPPEMWSEDAFFALRVKPEDGPARVRLLYHDDGKTKAAVPQHEYTGMYVFPFLRQVERIAYTPTPPIAQLDYADRDVELDLSLEAFTPLIPHNARDSAIPAALMTFSVTNTGRRTCEASLMFSMRNCAGYDHDAMTLDHRVLREGEATMVRMSAEGIDPSARTAGTTVVGVVGPGASVMPAWTDGRGLEGFPDASAPAMCQTFYPFRDRGELAACADHWSRAIQRRTPTCEPGRLLCAMYQAGWTWRGAVCRKLRLEPGQSGEVTFVLAWHFPNHYHYFDPEVNLGHMYANWFDDAVDVARYVLDRRRSLRDQTVGFRDHLYRGSMPAWMSASLAAQLTTFPQSFWWTREGDFAAWEGSACCQIISAARTIWSSIQPLALFPELYVGMCKRMARYAGGEDVGSFLPAEGSRRDVQQKGKRDAFGGWFENRFRDLGYSAEDFRRPGRDDDGDRPRRWSPLIAGASAMQTLRDVMWTGDEEYLGMLWPLVKAALDRGLAGDRDGDGLPDEAISWITYDHWFLPGLNAHRCSLWLGELQAGAELARRAGDDASADRYEPVLARGREAFERRLWNGEYYHLAWDFLQDKPDPGCIADQTAGQLFARLCGLGSVHDEARVRDALRAVHRYNLTAEEGLLNGADPAGRDDWRYFARYSDRGEDEALGGQWVTPWTGTEYFVAAMMLAEGLVDEGFDVARDVYDRHVRAGMLYNHIECGEHYFRAMGAWSMLPALQGLVYDARAASLRVAPVHAADDHDTLLLLPSAWGRLRQRRGSNGQVTDIAVQRGALAVGEVTVPLPPAAAEASARVSLDGSPVPATDRPAGEEVCVTLGERLEITDGSVLSVTVGPA